MRRSDALIKIVTLIVFLTLAVYIAMSAYNAKNNTLRTVLTDSFELTDSVEISGYAVRYESVLSSDEKNIAVTAKEGDRISAGAAVAVSYTGSDALRRAEEIRELKLKLEQLSSEKTGRNGEEAAREVLFDLSEAVAEGDLTEMDALALRAETYILGIGETGTDSPGEAVNELSERLKYLTETASSDTHEIFVSGAGLFSRHLDGLEGISPENLQGITPSALKKLFSEGGSVHADEFGKLVSGTTWYYAAVLDAESARMLEVGRAEELRFRKTYNGTLSMTVESISAPEDGKCVAVFSCDRSLKDVAPLRELYAELVFSHKEGLRVPREAVHLDENGDTFVYVLQGLQAQKIVIDILGESGDVYMAAEESGGLREGDQIIAAGNGLYDGKVVT